MHSYWAGESYWAKPMTEVIASGIGLVANVDLRKLAYERIIKREPHASKLLAFSAAKFFYGIESAGLVKPFIVREGSTLVGDYYIDMREFETGAKVGMEDVLKYCEDKGATFPYDSVCDTSGFQVVSDFNGRFVIDNENVLRVYNSVHGI